MQCGQHAMLQTRRVLGVGRALWIKQHPLLRKGCDDSLWVGDEREEDRWDELEHWCTAWKEAGERTMRVV